MNSTRVDSRRREIIPEIVAPATTKKTKILSDPDVKPWYLNLCNNSTHTGEVALRRLSRFCEVAQINHKSLIKLEQKQLEDLVQDTVRKLQSMKNLKTGKPYAPDYILGIIKGLKPWLAHNDRELKRESLQCWRTRDS